MAVAKQTLYPVYPGHTHDARVHTDTLGQLLQLFYRLHNEPLEEIHFSEMSDGDFFQSADPMLQLSGELIR